MVERILRSVLSHLDEVEVKGKKNLKMMLAAMEQTEELLEWSQEAKKEIEAANAEKEESE